MSQVNDYTAEFIELDDSLLVPCEHCHRTFREEVVERHSRVCASVWSRRNPASEKKPERIELPVSEAELRAKRNNWRIRHRHLQAAIQSAKTYVSYNDKPEEKPSSVVKHPVSGDIVNLVTCPTCGRRYNERTAQRHFDYCAKRKERLALLRDSLRPKGVRPKKEDKAESDPASKDDEKLPQSVNDPNLSGKINAAQIEMSDSASSSTPALLSNCSSISPDSLMLLMNQMSQMMSQMGQPPMSQSQPPVSPVSLSQATSVTHSPLQSPPQSPIPLIIKPSTPTSPTTRSFPKPLAQVRAEPPIVQPCPSPLLQQQQQNQQSLQQQQQNQQSLQQQQPLQLQQSMYPFYNPMQHPMMQNNASGMQQSFPGWNCSYQSMRLQPEVQGVKGVHPGVAKFCCGCGSPFSSNEDKFCARCGAKRILM